MDFLEKVFTFWNKKYLQKPYCLTKEKVILKKLRDDLYLNFFKITFSFVKNI